MVGYTNRSGAFEIFGFHNIYNNKKDDCMGSTSEMFMGICSRKCKIMSLDLFYFLNMEAFTLSLLLPSS